MAMTITERVREQLDGKAFRIFSVTGMVTGETAITAASLDLDYILMAQWNPTAMVICGISEAPGLLVTNKGKTCNYIGNENDAGTLTVWGS